jgi:adhesin HecA-like repeat protein
VLDAEDRDGGGRDCALAKLQVRRATVQLELARIDLAAGKLKAQGGVAALALGKVRP